MSEYSKRMLAFSAIAIALGVGISLGVVLLPTGQSAGPSSPAYYSSNSGAVASSSVSSQTTPIHSATTTVTSAATTTVSSLTTVEASTAVSSPSSQACPSSCGSFSITSVSLSVGENSSTLVITLFATGEYIGSATVYVNNTVIGTPPAAEYQPPGNIPLDVRPNQSSTLVLVIPSSTISIQAGYSYSVLVYGWLGLTGGPADSGLARSESVTAT